MTEAELADLEDSMLFSELTFDVDKSSGVTLEEENIVRHTGEGKAYSLSSKPIIQGCCEWKVTILSENSGNEGTCVGVSTYPISDSVYRTTSCMWLYRAYRYSLIFIYISHSFERVKNT